MLCALIFWLEISWCWLSLYWPYYFNRLVYFYNDVRYVNLHCTTAELTTNVDDIGAILQGLGTFLRVWELKYNKTQGKKVVESKKNKVGYNCNSALKHTNLFFLDTLESLYGTQKQ